MEWIDVVNHLRTGYPVGQVTDHWIELWWRFQEGRLAIRQQQTVWIAEADEETYYVVASEVGVPRRLRPAFHQRARAGIGTLVEDGDRLELRITLPARGLTPPALDRVLFAIAREAVQLALLPSQRAEAYAPAPAPQP